MTVTVLESIVSRFQVSYRHPRRESVVEGISIRIEIRCHIDEAPYEHYEHKTLDPIRNYFYGSRVVVFVFVFVRKPHNMNLEVWKAIPIESPSRIPQAYILIPFDLNRKDHQSWNLISVSNSLSTTRPLRHTTIQKGINRVCLWACLGGE